MSRFRLDDDAIATPPHDRALIEAEVGCELTIGLVTLVGRKSMKTIRAEKDFNGRVRVFAGQYLTVDDDTCAKLMSESDNFTIVDSTDAAPVEINDVVVEHEPPLKSKKNKGSSVETPGAPPEE